MPEYTNIRLVTEGRCVDLDIGQRPADDHRTALRTLSEYLAAVAAGVRHAAVEVNPASTRSSNVATFGTTDGNITVNGTVIAYTGASAAARAADAAAKIAASAAAVVKNNVDVEYVAGATTVTLRAKVGGTLGNLMTLAITGTGASVTGANFAGGADGTLKKYRSGI